MRSWYAIRARAEGAEVSIYDEIGAYGVSAKSFLDELGALPSDGRLTVRLNSPGGSVFDAVAIYNALKRHAGPVSVWIDGIAASAASYIAMAGDEVVMPENAFLMIHDPSGVVMGTADDMRAMAEALDKIKGSLVAGYVAKSGGAEDDIAALMAKETWLDAAEAVELGFADRLAEPVRIAARFDIGRFRNAPPALVVAVEAAVEDTTDDGATEPEEAEGSTQLVSRIDHEDVPKVATRLAQVKRGDGAPEAVKAQGEIDRLLAEDNADGFVYEDGKTEAVIIAFPGASRPRPVTYGPFNQEGSLDGLLISIGGADQTVHVQLQNGEVKYVGIETDRETARRLAKHMYEPIRVFGIGRWIRDAEGQWLLRKFRLQTFAVLQADDLREAAARLRQVEGSDWGKIDDPLAVLKALRDEGKAH